MWVTVPAYERPQRGIMSTSYGRGRALRLTRPPPGIFCRSYRCHSMACLDREGLEFGDKIILPQAAFQEVHFLLYCGRQVGFRAETASMLILGGNVTSVACHDAGWH